MHLLVLAPALALALISILPEKKPDALGQAPWAGASQPDTFIFFLKSGLLFG
jgi:hypothetical protein